MILGTLPPTGLRRWFQVWKYEKTDRFYIGSTNDLERRLKEHLKGKTRTTRILGTDKLVYVERYKSEDEARKREKKLKSYKSKKYIKWLISKNQAL